MVSSTLCPAVHILGSQNAYGRAEGIADHYWPWAVFCFRKHEVPFTKSPMNRRIVGLMGLVVCVCSVVWLLCVCGLFVCLRASFIVGLVFKGRGVAACGASYTFGCTFNPWMDGCKFAKSRVVSKFRLPAKKKVQKKEKEKKETKKKRDRKKD